MPASREDMPTLADLHRKEMLEIFATNISMICNREISETSTASGQSPNNYKKLVNDNLLKLNSNISDMLTESFKGIDSICSKVRECISDFNTPELLEAAAIQPIPNHPESFADDKDTQQMIEKQKQEQLKYAELTKRYEGYRQRLRAEGGLPPELDASLFNKTDQEVKMVQEVPMVKNEKTVIKEGVPEENESGCELESGALLEKSNVEQEDDELEQNAEINTSKIDEKSTDAPNPDNLSEIAELSVTENVNIVEPKMPKLKRSISKSKLERPKKRLRRRSLEEYTQAVKKEVDNADFESLQVIIQNLTERIDMLSTETLNEKCEKINKPKEVKEENYHEDPFKGCTFASFEPNEKETIDDLYLSTTNSIRELLGAALSKALEVEPVKRGKPRLNLTEVHHRPAFTNLHKKLLLQADTSESFLSLQRLMAKHKVKNSIIDRVFSKLKIPLLVSSSSESLKEEEESKMLEPSDLNLQDSEDDQISDLSAKYADSLYFNEKNMFKSSKVHLVPQPGHRSKKSMSNYSSSVVGMDGNTEKVSPTATTLKLNNGTWQSKLKKSTPKLIDSAKSRNKNHFKSGSSSLNMSAPKQRSCKRNSEVAPGRKRYDNKENIFGTLVERNQSLFSLPNTKSSGSSVNVGLKSRSTVVRSALSKENMNDPTKTAPCEDEDLGVTEEAACFSGSERPVCQCGVTNSSNANDDKTVDKTKYHWMRPRNDMQMRIRGLDYLDILDDLTHKDLLPLRSEYPRKDLVDEEELGLDQNKDIQDTYLWKMMYGKEKNDNIWSHLLQPKVECVDKTCHFYDHQEKEKRVATPVSLLDLPDKSFRALKQKSKRKTIEKLAPYLFDPKEERNNQSLIVMPVRVHYDNPPTQIIKHNIAEEPEIIPCATPKPAKRVKTSKLGPPSMKEVKSERAKWVSPVKSKKRITSVQSIPKTNVRVHKVDDIKKEKHSVSKKDMSKPLTAFVPSFDDPQPEPQKLTPQQTAYKKAIMRNLNRLMEIKQKEKKEQQKIAAKDLALQQKYLATTNFPHYARPTIQSQNYFQRPAVAQNSDQKIDPEKKHVEANPMTVIKKLADIKQVADQRKPSPRAVDMEPVFSDSKSDFERKMLSYKYGKSVGDKLVSFLNHQPPSPHLVITPPDLLLSPLPAAPLSPADTSNIPKVGSATGGKFLLNPNLMKGDNAKNTPLATPTHKPTMNHRQVLLHLRGLKKKNSQIQNNIQKTISVIEDKMVDILNAPGNNTSLEAFDVMEKEITKVLSMMKSQGANSAASNRDKELLLENNLQDISIELFSKLEKILDSEHSKEATSASETDGKVTVRSSGEGKKKKSRKAADRSSSVTTLLTEEKYRESQRNAKQKTNKPAQAQSETKMKTQNYMPAEKEIIATVENELAMGENVVNNDDDISEHIFDNKEDIDRDQGDQGDQPDKETVTKANVEFSDSDLDVIWDSNEQIERLDKLLRELQEENANRDDMVEENDEAVLKRQNATTRLETVLSESKAEVEEEEDSGDLLESISSRIDAFLESPRSEEMPVSARMEELSESVDRVENDYYNPQSKDFPSPRCQCSSTTDTKADISLSTPCINYTSSSDSSLSEFPHKEDSSTVSPINETTSSDDEFLTPLRTELNLTSLEDDFLTPPEDLLLARLEEDALSSPDEQMFTPSGGQQEDERQQEELWTSRDEMLTPPTDEILTQPSEMLTPSTDEKLTPLTNEKLTPVTGEKLTPLSDELFVISNEEMSTPLDDEVSPEGVMLGSLDEIENNIVPDSEDSTSDISDQMNEIIKKVEDIYAQLNDFQMPIDEKPTIPVFSDEKNVPQVPSEEFLTPFMHAVRDTRSRLSGDIPNAPADSLESSPSFCNILHFLDTLNDIEAEKIQEVHTTQLYNSAYCCYTPGVLHQANEYSDTDMHSCLKTRDDFKRKKKVSFSVTEDEISQVSLQEHLSKSLSNVIHLEVDCVSIEDRPAEEIQPDDSSEYSFASADALSSPESPRTVIPSKDHLEPSVPVNGSYGKQISLFKNQTTKIEPSIGLIGEYSSTTELLKLVPSKEVILNFDYTPSFCNLINFFDTLNEMDAETAQEIHTARLYQTAYAYSIPSVLHQATIEYPIEYSLPDKHSCLRTSNDAKQKKKVSFYEVKEDERAQSSFQMIKRTKMSIEQLPRLEDSKTSSVSSSKEHLEQPTKSDSVSKVVQNVTFDSSNDSSEKEDSYTFGDTTPPSETIRNTSEISIVEENNGDNCSSTNIIIKNRQTVGTPSITVIREYSHGADLSGGSKKCNPPTYAQLVPSKEMLMNFKDNNVVFLKSFYAFMYLLVFTALNMEYKCY